MFLMKGHGTQAVNSNNMRAYGKGKAMSAEAACGFMAAAYPSNPKTGDFRYHFDAAPTADPDGATMTAKLDALADATVQHDPLDRENSAIPPVFTYMGQFIDHDITANTDREAGISIIDTPVVSPLPRTEVSNKLGNLRFASLNLDSVYGDNPEQGDISKMLQKTLRWEQDRAKLQGGLDNERTHFPVFNTNHDQDTGRAEFAKDANRDVLRLGRASEHTDFDRALIDSAPEEIREMFLDSANNLKERTAVIGDARNDENLAVAQFHLAIQRLHNELVDNAPSSIPASDREAVFEWAQKTTRWIYQWLVVNAYLPAVCDPAVLARVMSGEPRLYDTLINDNPPSDPDLLPMPLEFSVSTFRFGHSMAREAYDWNRIFGRRPDGTQSQASFNLLFLFTGGGGLAGQARLPSNWPIAWDRFVHPVPAAMKDRSARKIDTHMNLDLSMMTNEAPGDSGIMRHLAKRNLRRGYRLNVPSAQGCLGALSSQHGIDLDALTEAELLSGHTGDAVRGGGFETATPLWFYVLKEAEIKADGNHLGPLGSLLVADTLIGLLKHSPDSYFNAAPGGRNWEPKDTVKPNGVTINDMPSMMAAAGLL
jgi:hypothetical protein